MHHTTKMYNKNIQVGKKDKSTKIKKNYKNILHLNHPDIKILIEHQLLNIKALIVDLIIMMMKM